MRYAGIKPEKAQAYLGMPFMVGMKRLKHVGIYIGTSVRKGPIPAIPTTPADQEFCCGMPALYPVVERASALSWGWLVMRGIEKSAPYAKSGHFVGPDGEATAKLRAMPVRHGQNARMASRQGINTKP